MESKKKKHVKKKKPVNLDEFKRTKEFTQDIKTGKLYDDLKKKSDYGLVLKEYVKIPVSVSKKTYDSILRTCQETHGDIPIEEFLSGVVEKMFDKKFYIYRKEVYVKKEK